VIAGQHRVHGFDVSLTLGFPAFGGMLFKTLSSLSPLRGLKIIWISLSGERHL